jgi:hypothetical protein
VLLDGEQGELLPVPDPHLSHYAAEVVLYRLLANAQALCDFLVLQAARHERDDL